MPRESQLVSWTIEIDGGKYALFMHAGGQAWQVTETYDSRDALLAFIRSRLAPLTPSVGRLGDGTVCEEAGEGFKA